MPKQSPGHPAGPLNNALVLNQDQEAASQAIFQFLLSEEKEFSISGPAGTGKTTLMKHVMTSLLPEYSDACKLLGIKPLEFEIVLTATTNKATEVLSSATGSPVTVTKSANISRKILGADYTLC